MLVYEYYFMNKVDVCFDKETRMKQQQKTDCNELYMLDRRFSLIRII